MATFFSVKGNVVKLLKTPLRNSLYVLAVIYHIQMVVAPFLRNNPSAVMFFQRFIFPVKTFREKYSERIWVFHCR